jgi:hypothetical protein
MLRTIAVMFRKRDIRSGVASRRFATRLLSVASIVGLSSLLLLGNAYPADSYEGVWTGSATVTKNGRCKSGNVTLTVSDKLVLGEAKFDVEARSIRGTVQSDGTVGATVGFQHLTGKFIDDSFEGHLQGSECAWTVILRRTRTRGPSSFGPLQRFASGVQMFATQSQFRSH